MKMEAKLAEKSDSNKKVKKTWSQTKRKGDDTEEVKVEKLDGPGYLVTVYKSWVDNKGIWQSEEKKIYAEDNPLSDEKESPLNVLADFLVGNKK